MKSSQRLLALATPVVPFFLAACSGGGGGGLSQDPAAITAANATEVAQVMPAALEMIEFEELMGFETLTEDGEGTITCPSGGTASAGFDVDLAPIGVVSTGDRFSVEFRNCMLDGSSELDGSIVIDFNTIDGDYLTDDTWEVDIDLTFDDLTFSSGPASGSFDGSWSQNATYDMGDASFSVAGDFTTSLNDGTSLEIAAFSGVTMTCDYDSLAGESSYAVDGTFASTEMGGSVTMTTLTPIVIADGALYAHSGVMRAMGSGGSRLTLTVLDDTFVRLDVDEDGDGNDEFMVTTTWAQLDE